MMLRLAALGLLLPALFTAPSSRPTTSLRDQTAAILQEALTAGDRSSAVDAAGLTRSGQRIVSLEPGAYIPALSWSGALNLSRAPRAHPVHVTRSAGR
jgi:hypothetical protein